MSLGTQEKTDKTIFVAELLSKERADALRIAVTELALDLSVAFLDPAEEIYAAYYAHIKSDEQKDEYRKARVERKKYRRQGRTDFNTIQIKRPSTPEEIKRNVRLSVELADKNAAMIVVIETVLEPFELTNLWQLTEHILLNNQTSAQRPETQD